MNNKQAKEMADKYNQNIKTNIIECLESYKTTIFQDLDNNIRVAASRGFYGFTTNIADILYKINLFQHEYLTQKDLDTGANILVSYLQEYSVNNGFKLLRDKAESEHSQYYTISWSDENNN